MGGTGETALCLFTVGRYMWRVRQVGMAVVALLSTVGYVAGLGWTLYGMQPLWPFWAWVLLGVGALLLWLVRVDERSRSHWVAGLLVGLGVGLAIFGWIGDGGVGSGPVYVGEEVYYGMMYEWTSNTLHFGRTIPGGDYPARVHPNRALLVAGTLLTTTGVFLGIRQRTLHTNPEGRSSAG